MLNNTPINDKKQDIKRKIIFIMIGLICFISIIIAIVSQMNKITLTKLEETVESEIMDFKSIFDNKLNEQENIVKSIQKINKDENIVYTEYEQSEKIDEKYEINIKIPVININNSKTIAINKEIEDIFREKARSIVENYEDYEVIYTVEYTAYINSNILSLVIKSNLKEGTNAQRVIVKTYTYNMTTNELVDINGIISIKHLDKSKVQKEINSVVEKNAKQAQSLIDLGYKVYQRDLSDEIYNIEKSTNFLYGPNGTLYIIYAYGNNNYTSELDVIPIK